jgi:hypothetical protein
VRRLAALVLAGSLTAPAVALAADLEAERRELLRLQAQFRAAHLGYDADLLVSTAADPLVSVDSGRVSVSSQAEQLALFRRYFGEVRFLEWDDAVPPQVTLADDGTLAVVLVQKTVRAVAKTAPASAEASARAERFAWVETWRKQDGRWRMVMIASTRGEG